MRVNYFNIYIITGIPGTEAEPRTPFFLSAIICKMKVPYVGKVSLLVGCNRFICDKKKLYA